MIIKTPDFPPMEHRILHGYPDQSSSCENIASTLGNMKTLHYRQSISHLTTMLAGLAGMSLLLACHPANAQSVTFASSLVTLQGGSDSGPTCLAVADVNGDGHLDVIVSNYGFRWGVPGDAGGWNNTLAVLTNDGSGSFTHHATLTVGHGPASVIAVDVNADGKPDLVCANQTDDTLTVLANDGSGGFSFSATLAVGDKPNSVVATDADGDGSMDLVCANNGSNTLSVLTNNDSGGFTASAPIEVGLGAYAVVAVDINHDNAPDLVCANNLANTLSILTNNGSGGFVVSDTIAVGNRPDAITAADFNGDGKPDLACVNWGANTLTILTNNGSGGFASNATLNVGSSPSTVAAGDFNGDGSIDLACANSGANTLTVLTNNGSGVFSHNATIYQGNIPNIWPADVNADGKPDLVLANFRDGTLTVLNNSCAFSTPSITPTLTIQAQGNHVQVTWPSASPGWSLQRSPDLSAGHWLPCGYDGDRIDDDATNKSATLPNRSSKLFFRLIHP
jgi:hypothetical protein